jgi:hypothetical protein
MDISLLFCSNNDSGSFSQDGEKIILICGKRILRSGLPEFLRRHARLAAENSAEIAAIRKSYIKGNLGNALITISQQLLGLVYPISLQV